MNKLFTKLKLKDMITLAAIIIIAFVWILIDQSIFKQTNARFIALAVLLLILFFFQFQINKPESIFKYAATIAFAVLSVAIILTLVLHVLINHDFSSKLVLIWLILFVFPFASAGLYAILRRINPLPE
jgi:FtsH-binding integral membrane protein